MSILITGGLGFIGSHIVVELQKHHIIIIDNLVNSDIKCLDNIEKITGKRPSFYQCDITDYNALNNIFKQNTIDTVIHLAGYKAVGESVTNPLKYYDNNVNGLINVLKCMELNGVKKIIFSSSATVYGHPQSLPITENNSINILNPYGQTKHMCELILRDCTKAYKMSTIILRYFNPVGAHQSGFLCENPKEATNLFPVIINVYKGNKKELEVFGDNYNTKDGTAVRDYIHVVDLAQGHVKALEYLNDGVQVFNLGTGNGYSVLEIIKGFEKHYRKLPFSIKGKRVGDAEAVYADCTKAAKLLNWKASNTLDDMIRSTLVSHKLNYITTFVTAFFVVKGYNNPGKSVEKYFQEFLKLVSTGIPLSVYISPEYQKELEEIANKYINVKIAGVIDIKETWVYKTANVDGINIPANRNPLKDTFEYMVCQNCKIECIYNTIQQNPFHTEYFAWVDFGLFHVLKDVGQSTAMLHRIATTPIIKDAVIFPGCWNKGYDYIYNINWRCCGGFLIGNKNALLDMWKRYQEFLPLFIKKYNLMTWEVNIWAAMEMETDWNIHWYNSGHDDSIINIPDHYFIQ